MNIALITITYNDNCRFKEWVSHYQEYKDELYMHIIVDNNSSENYQKLLKESFPNSIIIELGYNGGCTAAYNAGIKYALEDPQVDAISLMGNDIKVPTGNMTKLYKFLMSDPSFSFVFPIILNPEDDPAGIIKKYGQTYNKDIMAQIPMICNKRIEDLPNYLISGCGPGGCNLAKRSFYEISGLQDEKMFMYSDEVDTAIRAAKHGLVFATTKDVLAWHLHINEPGKKHRNPMAAYLMSRNHIYLARKHFDRKTILSIFISEQKNGFHQLIIAILKKQGKEGRAYAYGTLRGSFAGLFNIMKNCF